MRVLFHHSTCHRASVVRRTLLTSLFSLFFVFPSFAQGQPDFSDQTLVLVDFKTPACNGFWPILKSELERSDAPKLLGGSVLWMTQDEFRNGMQFRQIYQLRLQGDCRMASPRNGHDLPREPLGWVLMINEHIEPFVYVDCDRVSEALRQELRSRPVIECRRILARAISRIVFHELTHIVTQSPLHNSTGLQKAYLSPSDLLAGTV
jgi:hypothetical protein